MTTMMIKKKSKGAKAKKCKRQGDHGTFPPPPSPRPCPCHVSPLLHPEKTPDSSAVSTNPTSQQQASPTSQPTSPPSPSYLPTLLLPLLFLLNAPTSPALETTHPHSSPHTRLQTHRPPRRRNA